MCVCVCVREQSCHELTDIYIGLMSRVFANCLGDQGSILGRVRQKTQKWYLISPCLTLGLR